MLEEVEKNYTRQIYQKNNAIKGGYQKYEHFLKNDDGTIITTKTDNLSK